MPHLNINNTRIYFELHGPPDAPVIVLNNGVIMNAATSWVFQTAALSARYRLLQYDCRGQGQSDHPDESYTMAGHAADLAGLLDALEIPRAHIAGISYGGEVAQAFALDYPEMVRSLVLIDTVSEVRSELRIVIASWLDALRAGDPGMFFNVTVPWNFSPVFIRANPELLADAKRRYADLDFPAVIRLCECFLDVDFTDRLGEITAPTCIMVGEKDIFKGPEYAQIIKAGIPHAEYHVLTGAGHASCWESPAIFNRIILDFVERHS